MDKIMKSKYARIIELAFLVTHDNSSNIVEVEVDFFVDEIWVRIFDLGNDSSSNNTMIRKLSNENLDDIIVELERLYERSWKKWSC